MEEIEIINRIKSNDNVAFEEFLKKHEKIIQSVISVFDLEFGDFKISHEDLFQEGMIAFYEACRNYDEKYNARFSTFAYVVIKRRIHHYYYSCLKRYQNESYSIDTLELQDYFLPISSSLVCDSGFDYALDDKKDRINKILSNLKNEDKQILEMRINSYSYDEIAKHLNINRKRVDNRLFRLKQRLLKSELCA